MIELQPRESGVKARDLLEKNIIPVEFYGKGVKNLSLQADYQTFRRLYKSAGKNTVIELNVDGKKYNALVHDVQYAPISDKIMHVDFISVRMDQIITAVIPLKFVGLAPAVKELGGILTHTLHEITVKCLPGDLIPFIEVSVDPITTLHSYVRVKDLNVPSTLTVVNPPDEVVVTAVAPKVEEEAAPVAAVVTAEAGAAVPGATPEAEEGKK